MTYCDKQDIANISTYIHVHTLRKYFIKPNINTPLFIAYFLQLLYIAYLVFILFEIVFLIYAKY